LEVGVNSEALARVIDVLKPFMCPNESSTVVPCVILKHRDQYLLGNDPIRLKLKVNQKGDARVVTRIRSVEFDEVRGLWFATLQNGMKVVLSSFGDDYYPAILKHYVRLAITRRSNYYIAYVQEIFGAKKSAEEFFSAIDKLGDEVPPWVILGLFMGYMPTNDIYMVLVPRLVTMVPLEKPVYTLQILPKGTGKTHFGVYVSNILGWEYAVEAPSYAFLIYNHRDKVPGAVMTKEGIAFDGVDKWSQRIYVDYEILLTGMDNCLWSRAVGTGSSINKCMKMVFLGNPRDRMGMTSDRTRAEIALNNPYSEVFMDRVALVHAADTEYNVVGAIMEARIDDSYLPSYLDYIYSRADKSNVYSALVGRMKKHSENLQVALRAIGVYIDSEEVDRVVELGWENYHRGGD